MKRDTGGVQPHPEGTNAEPRNRSEHAQVHWRTPDGTFICAKPWIVRSDIITISGVDRHVPWPPEDIAWTPLRGGHDISPELVVDCLGLMWQIHTEVFEYELHIAGAVPSVGCAATPNVGHSHKLACIVDDVLPARR